MRALLPCLLVLGLACSGARGEGSVRVFCAASLVDVVERLAPDGTRVSAGSSATLARQILDGAPADVFVSAHGRWVDELVAAGAVDGSPRVLARNGLVLIAPATGGARPVDDLAALADEPPGTLAVGAEGVPAGEYARQALATAGVLDALTARLVGQRDVRAVLAAVSAGHVDAGIVYVTDARAAGDAVRVLCVLDAGLHEPIECLGVVLREAADADAARAALDALGSDAARQTWRDLGFEVP